MHQKLNSFNSNWDSAILSKIERVVALLIIIASCVVMTGWLMEYRSVLTVIPGGATMKFNTALCFALSGIALLTLEKNKPVFILSTILLTSIGFFSLIEYLLAPGTYIDTLFVNDPYSANLPGRMSQGTALNFTFLGLGFLMSRSTDMKLKWLSRQFYVVILTISFLSIITYIVMIPIDKKIVFIETMAIHTSILFLVLSFLLSVRNPESRFHQLVLGRHTGSKLLRRTIPFLIVVPLIVSQVVLVEFYNGFFSIEFGLIVGAVGFIFLSIASLIYVSNGLNRQDEIIKKQNELKEQLLRETHHRVKNNFQMVNSLLRLSAYNFEDKKLKAVLDECQSRIAAVAKLHENIYRFGNYEAVDIDIFLREITDSLIKSYAGDKQIRTEVMIETRELSINQAIPLGLITNEVVTNSIKHGFKGRDEGLIRIALTKVEEDNYEFTLSDDGVGKSSEDMFPDNSQKIGSKLIEVFTAQLDGTLERFWTPGSAYRIIFKSNSDEA